ncbi:MAG: tetratricopeptide repeat protein [Chitinispirillia bacterium]|nr:tetratricopeptide repeat protein [Chitinispirillia bacterium]MCL2242475.1 tetratricopeptide repeat protein [Chitinispirillia bacterium]
MNLNEEWFDLPDLLDKVQELLDLGFADDARALLDKYQSTFSDCWEYHFVYSRIYAEQNRPREAVKCLITGLRLERDNVDCLIGLFYAYAMMNRIRHGGRFLLRAGELYPDNDMVMSALVWYYTELNDLETAIICFDQAKRLNSNNVDTYRNGAVAFDRLGKFEEAEECYKMALRISPNCDEARDMYADHLIFTGRTIEAVKLYEVALAESPENIRHMSKLIYCLSQKGDFTKAEELAKRSIEKYPNSPLGYIDLAYVHLNTGCPGAAAEIAEKAISVAPVDAEGYRIKAIAYSDRGDYRDAETLFEKAHSLDPENSDILRDYYQHLRLAGKYKRMLDTIDEVIKLEHPHCAEDYWYLADYYREKKQNIKAFRYLRLAYNCMPAEKELLPPMMEILVEQGHTKYSLPILADYVRKSGWSEAINNFSKNYQFRDRATQEGMRFLRFTGQRPMEFRKYIFNYYLYRYGFIYYTLIMAAFLFPATVLLGWVGLWIVASVYSVSVAVMKIIESVLLRKLAIKTNQPPDVRG